MAESEFNFQAQAASKMDAAFIDENDNNTPLSVKTIQKGQIDAQQIEASMDVDPSTKDDECMSNFVAQKNVKKYQKKEKMRKLELQSNNVKKSEKSKIVTEQNIQDKRVETYLGLINNQVLKDLNNTIKERSNALFSGSEQKYQTFFEKMDALSMQRNATETNIKNALNDFNDIAEQHNALQIICDVWERKLSNLKQLARNVRAEKREGGKDEADYRQLQQQIQQLERQLNTLKSTQMKLMADQGNRIKDSYKLAPLLREATAHFTHDITLPPKTFNALILDKILPLEGNILPTFNCLTQSLIENFQDKTKNAIEHFNENLDIVKKCLTSELKSCPNSYISSAILNVCRTLEKLDTIQELNTQIIQRIFQTFPHLA